MRIILANFLSVLQFVIPSLLSSSPQDGKAVIATPSCKQEAQALCLFMSRQDHLFTEMRYGDYADRVMYNGFIFFFVFLTKTGSCCILKQHYLSEKRVNHKIKVVTGQINDELKLIQPL